MVACGGCRGSALVMPAADSGLAGSALAPS